MLVLATRSFGERQSCGAVAVIADVLSYVTSEINFIKNDSFKSWRIRAGTESVCFEAGDAPICQRGLHTMKDSGTGSTSARRRLMSSGVSLVAARQQ